MSDVLNAALAYAAEGFRVFPCRKGTKIPATAHGCKDATTDVSTIQAWWAEGPQYNVAIATGDGLYVVDVDDPSSTLPQSLPPTRVSRTPRGGSHHLFQTDEELPNTTKKLTPTTDTRGRGGYIVVPPSHVDGRVYAWESQDAPIADLPPWIADAVRPRTAQQTLAAYQPSGTYGARALTQECDRVASTKEGSRNATLNEAAFKVAQLVAGGNLQEHEAMDALHAAGVACGLSEKEVQRTLKSAFAGGVNHPRGPAAKPDPFAGAEIICTDNEQHADDVKPVRVQAHDTDDAQWERLNRVMSLGGLCRSFPAWVLSGADYPQPSLAMAALISIGGAMGGRRLVYGRSTTPLYVCAIARTAEGKGRPQACVQRVLQEHWSHVSGPSDLSSTASTTARIIQATTNGTGLLYVLDEYGPRLSALMAPNNAHQRDLRAMLLQLATVGTGNYVASTSLAQGGQDRLIQVPALCLYGSTTPRTLHDALGSMAIDDGFLGRHIFFTGLSRLPAHQDTPEHDAVPQEIEAAILAIREHHERWHKGLPRVGSTDDGRPLHTYQAVPAIDGGGDAVLRDYLDETDARRRDHGADDPVHPALLGRAVEHARRVALVLALLSQPDQTAPTVTDACARVAIDLVRASLDGIAMSLRTWAAESVHERGLKMVLAACEHARPGPDGWVRRREISRQCRALKAQEIDEALARLAAEGEIEVRRLRAGKGSESGGGQETILVRLAR